VSGPADPERPRPRLWHDIDSLMTRYDLTRYDLRGHIMCLRADSARWTGSAKTSHLRVSDAERNEVADRLSRHFADGRLDQAEFKERLDAAMSATTRGDLAGLFDDLPPLDNELPAPPSRRRRLVPLLLVVVFLALAAGSTLSMLPVLRIPWLLIAVVGLLLWRRARHPYHPRQVQ
jgi:Domain of unknown function (DUF1707)